MFVEEVINNNHDVTYLLLFSDQQSLDTNDYINDIIIFVNTYLSP